MSHDRRTVLSALGLALPFGVGRASRSPAAPGTDPPPVLRFRSFEDAVRDAFSAAGSAAAAEPWGDCPCRRVEVGHADLLHAGVQGCHNDRPFAGFPAGHLRIVRSRSEPGPVVGGVRLYVSTVDVARTGGRGGGPSRPLDFTTLPPAPSVTASGSDSDARSR